MFDSLLYFFKNIVFFDPEDTIVNFDYLFELRFVPSNSVQIKCSFSIANFQPTPADGFVEITDIRVWCSNVYTCVYYNGYDRENIMKGAKQWIIIIGQTGTSWGFRRFNRLTMHTRTG